MNRGRQEVERRPSEEGAVQLTKDKSWRTESRGRDPGGEPRGAGWSDFRRVPCPFIQVRSFGNHGSFSGRRDE